MEYIQQLFSWMMPTPVRCDDQFDVDLPHDQAATEEDYSPVHNNKLRKVPGFQHLFNPVNLITSSHDFIRGFRCDFSMSLSEFFSLIGTWEIPNSGVVEEQKPAMQMMPRPPPKSNFTLTAQHVRDVKGMSPGTVMMTRIDTLGKVESFFVKKIHDRLQLKLSGSFPDSKVTKGFIMADLQYEDRDTASILKVGESPNGPLIGLNYMQRVHKNFMLGFDATHFTQIKKTLFGYAGKAFIGKHSAYMQYIHGQTHIGYVIPLNKYSTFVSHYKYEEQEKKSTAIVGFKHRFEQTEIVSTINSRGKVASSVTFKNLFYSFKFCAMIDYIKDKYTFGYGINIGQQQ